MYLFLINLSLKDSSNYNTINITTQFHYIKLTFINLFINIRVIFLHFTAIIMYTKICVI